MAEAQTSTSDRDSDMIARLQTLATTDPTVRRRQMRSLLRAVVGPGGQR